MKGRIVDLDVGEKTYTIRIETESDLRDVFDELHDCDIEFTVKKYRKKRSLDSNAYMWELLGKLSAKVGIPRIEMYREYIRNIGNVSDTVCVKDEAVEKLVDTWKRQGIGYITDVFPNSSAGYSNVILYYGSSTYNSEQMSRLIELVVFDCKENGIETMTPNEIAALDYACDRYDKGAKKHE